MFYVCSVSWISNPALSLYIKAIKITFVSTNIVTPTVGVAESYLIGITNSTVNIGWNVFNACYYIKMSQACLDKCSVFSSGFL